MKNITIKNFGTQQNKTANDAFLRVLDARTGCLVDATDDYLLALRHHLAKWDEEIKQELARRIHETQKRADAFEDYVD